MFFFLILLIQCKLKINEQEMNFKYLHTEITSNGGLQATIIYGSVNDKI
jgi:hypothetical protein